MTFRSSSLPLVFIQSAIPSRYESACSDLRKIDGLRLEQLNVGWRLFVHFFAQQTKRSLWTLSDLGSFQSGRQHDYPGRYRDQI
jgi:hypothetical protein